MYSAVIMHQVQLLIIQIAHEYYISLLSEEYSQPDAIVLRRTLV
jgi:hypothetical protein